MVKSIILFKSKNCYYIEYVVPKFFLIYNLDFFFVCLSLNTLNTWIGEQIIDLWMSTRNRNRKQKKRNKLKGKRRKNFLGLSTFCVYTHAHRHTIVCKRIANWMACGNYSRTKTKSRFLFFLLHFFLVLIIMLHAFSIGIFIRTYDLKLIDNYNIKINTEFQVLVCTVYVYGMVSVHEFSSSSLKKKKTKFQHVRNFPEQNKLERKQNKTKIIIVIIICHLYKQLFEITN